MTTSTDIFSGGETQETSDARARRAIAVFRGMQPNLSAYARVLSGNPKVRVELSSTSNGATDGVKIFYRPPMALGENTRHVRSLCDKRSPDGMMQCSACAARERVLVVIYHEIAHIVFETFKPPSEFAKLELLREATSRVGTNYAKQVKLAIDAASGKRDSFLVMARYINEFLPTIVNALEDARINNSMFNARPGTRHMFYADVSRIFREGVEGPDGTQMMWHERPLNLQVIVGLFLKSEGYDYSQWLESSVVAALDDEKLTQMMEGASSLKSAEEVFSLSFPVLSRLRELGFCKSDNEPVEPDPEPEPEEEEEDEESRPPELSGAPGTGGGGGSSADNSDDSGEDEEDSETDSGDGTSGHGQSGSTGSPGSEGSSTDSDGEGSSDDQPENSGSDGSSSSEGGSSGGTGKPEEGGAGSSGSSDSSESDGGDTESDDHEALAESGDSGRSGETDWDNRSDSQSESSSDQSGDGDDYGSEQEGDEGSLAGDAVPGHGEASDPEAMDASSDDESELVDDETSGEAHDQDSSSEWGDSDDGGVSRDYEGDSDSEGSSSDDSGHHRNQSDSDDTSGSQELGQDGDGSLSEADLDEAGASSAGSNLEHESDVNSDLDGSEPLDSVDGSDSDSAERDEDRAIDTGADKGRGGVQLEEGANPVMGTGADTEEMLEEFMGHEPDDIDPLNVKVAHAGEEEQDVEALNKAIMQGYYFEAPSTNVFGVNEFYWDERDNHVQTVRSPWTSLFTEHNSCKAWSSQSTDRQRVMTGASGDISTSESILGPALLRMRAAFTFNAQGKEMRHLKSGKINARVLGRRAHFGDERLFMKRTLPGKRSYFVVIGMDVSASTTGVNLQLEKQAVMAQANLLTRAGIDFVVYAHSCSYHDISQLDLGIDLHIYHIKDEHEIWNAKTQERLEALGPDSANIDGHTLEFYRKACDRSLATDKIILYFTDGKMPAENYDEELDILQHEIKVCKQKDYLLLGVGIRTDSPVRFGLDTVQVDEASDLPKVVKHLERRLSTRAATGR